MSDQPERVILDGIVDPIVESRPIDPPPRWWHRGRQRMLVRFESGRVAVVEPLYPGPVYVVIAEVGP